MPALRAASYLLKEKFMPARAKPPPMNVAVRKPWTQEEFFAWAENQDTRYEFDGFQPVAMTGGNVSHNRVMWGLHRALDTRLRRGRGPCEPLGPDAGIETINRAVRYPDALVTCSKVDGDDRIILVSSSPSKWSVRVRPHGPYRQGRGIRGSPVDPPIRHPEVFPVSD